MSPTTITNEEDLESAVGDFMMAVDCFRESGDRGALIDWIRELLTNIAPIPTEGTAQHPLLHDYAEHYRSPMQIIEAIKDAGQELDYSNYHNGMFARAIAIIATWCHQNRVPMGLTREEHRQADEAAQDAKYRELFGSLREQGDELLNWIKTDDKTGPPQWLRDYAANAQAEKQAKAEDQ